MQKDVLEQLISSKYSTRQIAEKLECSQNKVVNWLKKFGLKTSYGQQQKLFNCLNCNAGNIFRSSCINKYCNNKCQTEHRWKTVTKVRIENGECESSSSEILKKYLKEKRGYLCELCGLSDYWNSKPLTLQLDHIDGNSDNNMPVNLRLLCPNCHTQTETYGSKGLGSRYKKDTKRNTYLQNYKR